MVPSALRTAVALGMLAVAPQIRINIGPPPPLTAARVQEWADAVERHDAGQADESALKIAAWSGDELYQLFNEFRALEAFRKNPLIRRNAVNGVRYQAPRFEKNIMLLLRL